MFRRKGEIWLSKKHHDKLIAHARQGEEGKFRTASIIRKRIDITTIAATKATSVPLANIFTDVSTSVDCEEATNRDFLPCVFSEQEIHLTYGYIYPSYRMDIGVKRKYRLTNLKPVKKV